MNTSKPEIVFVYPYFDDMRTGFVNYFTYSIGCGYIRAYLDKHGIPSAQYVQFEPRTLGKVAEEIVELGSDVIGFSCLDSSFYFCRIIADVIKEINPRSTIIFGGPSVTLADEIIMRQNKSIDICCRGEGEATCYELLLKLKNKQDIGDVPGITYRLGEKIVRTPDSPLLRQGKKEEELDFLPSPYLSHMIPLDGDPRYNQYHTVITSRGCTHKCTYCTNTAISRNQIRFHSVNRVINEIKFIAQYIQPSRRVMFFDDAFTLDVERAKVICRRILDESLNYLNFECITRIDKFDEELLGLFVKAGFKNVTYGLESASPRILNIIKKIRTRPAVNDDYGPEIRFLETMKKNIRHSHEIGLKAAVSIILGLPGETRNEADETLKFVEDLNLSFYPHNYLNVIYGTEIFNTCQSHGINVKPSVFQLPYLTEYTYDVFDVKPLNNSFTHIFLEIKNKGTIKYLMSFFGVDFELTDVEKSVLIPKENLRIFLEDEPPPGDSTISSWLSSITRFTSDVFIAEKDLDFNTFQNRLQTFADARIPIANYHMVKNEKIQDKTGNPGTQVSFLLKNVLKTRLSTEKYTYNFTPDFRYSIVPFNAGSQASPAGEIDLHNEIIIKSIDTEEDLNTMLNPLTRRTGDLNLNSVELDQEDICAYNYDILDKCRWLGQSCGACRLNRLILRSNKDVLTCYSGTPVGSVGSSLNELESRIDNLYRAAWKRRGCSTCIARDNCSVCIFLPSFLSETNYCNLMRTFPDIDVAAEIPSALRELRIQKEPEIKKNQRIHVSWIPRSTWNTVILNAFKEKEDKKPTFQRLLKISMDDSAYHLYFPKYKAFSNLSRTMSDIWDRLSRLTPTEVNRETLCRTLAEERALSFEAISNAFDMLCNKIKSLLTC